ncbi:MAG TPA: hypothetical protein VHA78_02815 [Candidatus Peribacteraceae bacterium]|nr:hypothetical protein [Candidatus Peribacteraceae bacterium]
MAPHKPTDSLSIPVSDAVVPADALSINTGPANQPSLMDAAFLQFADDREWERWVEQCVHRGMKNEQMREIVRSIAASASLSNEMKRQLEEKMTVQMDRVRTSDPIDPPRKTGPEKRVRENTTTFMQRMKTMLGWEPVRRRRANTYTHLGMQSLEVRAVMDGSGDAAHTLLPAYTSQQIAGMTEDQVTTLVHNLADVQGSDQQILDDLGPKIVAAQAALQTASDHMKAADDALNMASNAMSDDQAASDAVAARVAQAKDALLTADKALTSLPEQLVADRSNLQNIYEKLYGEWMHLWRTPRNSQDYRDTLNHMYQLESLYTQAFQQYCKDWYSRPALERADAQAKQALQQVQDEQKKDDDILEKDQATQAAAKNADGAAHNDYAAKQKAVDALLKTQADTQEDLDETIYTLSVAQLRQNELQKATIVQKLTAQDNVQNAASLASDLATTVSQTLSEQAETLYPKMYIDTTPNGRSTIFNVRFATPVDDTLIRMNVIYGYSGDRESHVYELNQAGGCLDTTCSFSLEMAANRGSSSVTFDMIDAATGKVLKSVNAYYNYDNNNGGVSTQQLPFDYVETGMLETDPIQPDMKIVKTSGPNMLLDIQTPHDNAYVQTNMGGFLSTALSSCPGGSTFSLMRITVDANRPTGDYQLQLCNAQGGMIIHTLTFHWDQSSQTVTCDPSNLYAGDQSTAEGTQTFDNFLSVASAYMGDVQINQIEKTRLYWDTATLPAPYNFFIGGGEDLMNRILQVHPEYRPENFEASVDAMWDKIGHSYSRGQAQDMFVNGMNDYVNTMRDDLGVYEKAMSDVMQTAINGIIQILHGGNQQQQFEAVQQCLDRWNNVNHLAIYQSDYMKLGGLSSLGISLPSCGAIMEAAKRLYNNEYQQLIQTEQDVLTQREHDDFLREKGLRQTAEGDWVVASGNNYTPPPSDMDSSQIRLATKILNTLNNSNDPRIVALRDARKQELAIGVAQITATVTDPVQQTQALNQLADDTAQKQAVDDYVTAHQDDIRTSVASAVSNGELDNSDADTILRCINQKSELLTNAGFDANTGLSSLQTAIGNLITDTFGVPKADANGFGITASTPSMTIADEFKDVQEWFDPFGSHPDFDVRSDTIVGKIFLGLLQKLNGTSDLGQQITYSKEVADITDIPWFKIMQVVENSTISTRASQLMELFSQKAGYNEIFAASNAPGSDPQIFVTNIYDMTPDGKDCIRVRFDMAAADWTYGHASAYIMYQGSQYSDVPVGSEIDNQLFIRIPIKDINDQMPFSHGPIQIKIAAWFGKEDSQNAQSLQTHVGDKSTEITVPVDGAMEQLPIPNQEILTYLRNTILPTLQVVSPTEFMATEKSGESCKQWAESIIENVFNGKITLPGNKYVMDTNGNIQYVYDEWFDSNDVTSLGEFVNSTKSTADVKNYFQNKLSGDVIQMDAILGAEETPHTAIIDRIDANGVWVYDSNWGLRVSGMDDNTVRLHYFTFDHLAQILNSITIYRINPQS